MRRRSLLGVVVVVVVVLAGCSSSSTTGEITTALANEPTETPAPTPTATTTPTPTTEYRVEAKRVNRTTVYGEVVAPHPGDDAVLRKLIERNDSLTLPHGVGPGYLPEGEILKVGDQFYRNVTLRRRGVDYRLRATPVESAPPEEATVAFRNLSPRARWVVADAAESGAFYSALDGPREAYYSVADYERIRFGSAPSEYDYLRYEGQYYRLEADLNLGGHIYEVERVEIENVTVPVASFDNLSERKRRAFRRGVHRGELKVYGYGPQPPEFVNRNGAYFRIHGNTVFDPLPGSTTYLAGGERVSREAVYDRLGVVLAGTLESRTHRLLTQIIEQGRIQTDDPSVVERVESVLSEGKYVRFDGQFYQLYIYRASGDG